MENLDLRVDKFKESLVKESKKTGCTKLMSEYLIASSRSVCLFSATRAYFNSHAAAYRQLYIDEISTAKRKHIIEYEIAEQNNNKDEMQRHSKTINALNKRLKYFINTSNKECKQFDKYIGDSIDKLECGDSLTQEVTDKLIDMFDAYFRKAISVKDGELNLVTREPFFLRTVSQYADKLKVSESVINNLIKEGKIDVLTDKNGVEYIKE